MSPPLRLCSRGLRPQQGNSSAHSIVEEAGSMAVQRDALTWEIQGTTIRFPVWFRDAGAAVAGFVVPLAPVRRMLAASGLRPVGFAGRTLAVLALLDYREHEGNELGSYDEFG